MAKYYKHLQDYNYYSELYDKFTIEECQDWENKKHDLGDLSKLSKNEKQLEKLKKKYIENVVFRLALYFVKG